MTKLRIAILGTGFMADFHLQVYRRLPDVEVVALLGRDGERARSVAATHGVEYVTTSWDGLLAGPHFDAVDILLPNHLHHRYALLAAAAGKHMLCTKPLARTAQEAREMLDAAQAAGVIHFYAENWVFSPDMREIAALIKEGAVGRPLWIRGREGHAGPHSPWFYERALSGGGALLDLGCHVVGVFQTLLPQKPREVFCHAATLHHKTDCEDNALAVIRYEGGLMGQVEASWSQRGGMAVLLEVWGDEGLITYDRLSFSQPIKLFALRPTRRYIMEKAESNSGWLFPMVEEYWRYGYYDELKHFVRCVREGTRPMLTFADGVAVNRVIDAAYASAGNGRWEPVEA